MTQPLVTILDDEPEIRRILTDALEEAGFRTQSFSRAREFEACAETRHTGCLLWWTCPCRIRTGWHLVHRLALEQGAAVIIISGPGSGTGSGHGAGTWGG